MAGGCAGHHQDDQTPADRRNHLPEVDERLGGDASVEGTVLRPLHQAQRPEVADGLRRCQNRPSSALFGLAGERSRATSRVRPSTALRQVPAPLQDALAVHLAELSRRVRQGRREDAAGGEATHQRLQVRPHEGFHPFAAHAVPAGARAERNDSQHRDFAAEAGARLDLSQELQEDEGSGGHHADLPATQAARLRCGFSAALPAREEDARLRKVDSVAGTAAGRPEGGERPEADVPQLAGEHDLEEIPAQRVAAAATPNHRRDGAEETQEVLGTGAEVVGQLLVGVR